MAFHHRLGNVIALHDIAAKQAGKPLYAYLGGRQKTIESDLTIGISSPAQMADTAADFVTRGVGMIKVKLGKHVQEDIERMQLIRLLYTVNLNWLVS